MKALIALIRAFFIKNFTHSADFLIDIIFKRPARSENLLRVSFKVCLLRFSHFSNQIEEFFRSHSLIKAYFERFNFAFVQSVQKE